MDAAVHRKSATGHTCVQTGQQLRAWNIPKVILALHVLPGLDIIVLNETYMPYSRQTSVFTSHNAHESGQTHGTA